MQEDKDFEDVEYFEGDYDPIQAMDIVPDTMAAFFDTASVDRVYGEPIVKGDLTLIPTAEVLTVMGFGAGFGVGPADDEDKGDSGGGGGGGGGKTLARPVAVIVVSPEGVYVEPIVDRTKVILAAITAGGFMMATLLGFLSPRKALKQIQGD